jgi:hypothetical protein
LHDAVVPVLLLVVVWQVLAHAFGEEHFGVGFDGEGRLVIRDLASLLVSAKAIWMGRAGYDVPSSLRITSEWVGRSVDRSLPFPYPPTMLWILGPLCLLPTVWGFAVWTLMSAVAVWWMSRPRWSLDMAAAVLSPVAVGCFVLGQTALLTAAGLLLLLSRDLDEQARTASERRTTFSWRDVIVLWALTAKPPLALTGASALLAGRRFRAVLLALVLTVLSTALLTPKLGIGWVREYAHLMGHYDRESVDPAFAWSLMPQTMGNLRALLHLTFGMGDALASRWSTGLWLLALAGIVTGGLGRKLPAQACWALAVLAYLLLCPHVSWTEEVHLVLILALVAHATPPAASGLRWAVVGLVLVSLYVLPGVGGHGGVLRLPALVAAQALLIGLVWLQWVPVRPRS